LEEARSSAGIERRGGEPYKSPFSFGCRRYRT
jgi:hypothetical protein